MVPQSEQIPIKARKINTRFLAIESLQQLVETQDCPTDSLYTYIQTVALGQLGLSKKCCPRTVENWGRVVKNLYLLKETLGGTCKPVKTQLFRASSIPLHNEPGTIYIPHISQHYNRHQGTGLWELELYGAVLQCHHCDTKQGVYINFCTVINSSVHCNITGMHSYLMLYKQVLYI